MCRSGRWPGGSKSDLFEQAKKHFQEGDIETPFPYYNLVFKTTPPSSQQKSPGEN